MKLLIFILTFSTITHAFDRNRVCVGNGLNSCHNPKSEICADVTLLEQNTYRLSHLVEEIGCMNWGVSAKKSKQRLCRRILKKFGEKRKVSFVKGSAVIGAWETARDKPSVGSIDCKIKE